jgi:dienelactone hydrolase
MMMRIWYPTGKDITYYPAVEYMDDITFQWLKDRSPIPLITIPDDAYMFVNTHARDSPPISDTGAPFPVILFSHGYDGVYQIYTSLIEDLVSNGYIVVSINHPYIAGVTVFPDGRTVSVSQIPIDSQDRETWLSLGQRTVIEDLKFGLDVITDMNEQDPDYQHTMDLTKVGVYGHSFGGGATAGCCNEDSRFKAGLTLDGFFTAETIDDTFSTPFLLMVTGGRYTSDTSLTSIWENMSQDAYLLGIEGSQHFSYTDVGVLLEHLLPRIPAQLLGFGRIDQKRMINITITVERSFFDVYLRQASASTLEDVLNRYPEISFMMKE